jgi:hypothetical protein
VRRRAKVISGLLVGGAAAGLAGLVAYRVRHNHAEVDFKDEHRAVATVSPSGDMTIVCSCGKPDCEHMHAAAVVAAARIPRAGSALWHALRHSLDDMVHRPSREKAETTAGVAQSVLETEGLALNRTRERRSA